MDGEAWVAMPQSGATTWRKGMARGPLIAANLRVLSYLMHHGGKVVSRGELIEHIYAQDFDRDSNTVEVFIGRLRRKLGGPFIETVRGLGYRMCDAPAGEA